MWKTLGGFWAQMGPFAYILPPETAQIHCGVTGLALFRRPHLFITTLRTSPKALLRLVRQRWAIENQWHWPRDTQLGEVAHDYSHRNGVLVLALLRTMALNLLRWNGFRSIRAGLMAVAHDISRMLSWFGISAAETE